ncbi:MAG TPA: hypothetical protein VMD07_10850, partial [Candidatus Acidoferrales bacterium]|nr:hypothetical protein [Candidatus Acidoferrales bacterium]
RTMPDWDFHAAISGSRAERFDDALSLIFAERWYRIGDQREDRIFRFTSKLFRKQRYKASVRPVIDSLRESRVDTENLSASSTNL